TPRATDQRREWSPFATQPAFEPGPQGRGEERALALRRDRDQERVAAHDRRCDETALRRPVDDVDQDAGGLRLRPALAVDRGIVAGVEDKASAREVATPVVPRCDHTHRRSGLDRKSTRLNSSHVAISYAV